MPFKIILLTWWTVFALTGVMAGDVPPVASTTSSTPGTSPVLPQPAHDLRYLLQAHPILGANSANLAGKRLSVQEQALLRQQLRQFNRSHPSGAEGPGSMR